MATPTDNNDPPSFLSTRPAPSERCGLFAIALIFALLACWIFWIVQTSLEGRGWAALAVRVILYDLVLSVAFFAIGLALYALFLPRWLNRTLTAATNKLHSAIAVVLIPFALACVACILIFPLLAYFGLIK